MTALRFRYQTIEFGSIDIHLKSLRDRQEYDDPEGIAAALGISPANWSLFGVLWNSSEVLAQLMVNLPIAGKRILEVGCGLGLSSLLLNHRHADITATDYHPSAEQLLVDNVRLNFGQQIPFRRTDWGDSESGLGKFDLIIGSDLLYEQGHAALLAQFIDRHTRRQCEVILVDPGRGYQSRFSKNMAALGYTASQYKPKNLQNLSQPFNGSILRFARP